MGHCIADTSGRGVLDRGQIPQVTHKDDDVGRDPRYPLHAPELADLPGVELRFVEHDVHCWQAWRAGMCLAQSPWKKLTWKLAKEYLDNESEHLR